MSEHKRFNSVLVSCVCFSLVFTALFSSLPCGVLAQETDDHVDPEYFMGILILESQQQVILDSINKIKELQLGNMIILHPMDQAWDLTLIEEAISEADSLGLYTIFETYNFSDHEIRISPEQFSAWQTKYPHLLGILVQEIAGKQVDLNLWLDNSTETVNTRLDAEQAIIENITASMQLKEFKDNGARVFLQENVISYASANTSNCDVLITKVFNAPNTELMIGVTRGLTNSYDIPAWGLWVDTWREWVKPPADFTGNDVERALYEGWFYGAKYFFFEQGNFFGTLDRDWPVKHIILGTDGKLTEYGKAIQRFYAFLQNQNKLDYDQPEYEASIAVMIGQSGWSSRGKDWGLWDQTDRQGDFDFTLLNMFFPGIGDNWHIGDALMGKEFTGLPFGMVDVISVYAPVSVLKQYNLIIGLGWSQMTDSIAANIEDYVQDGGVFLSFLSFTHSNETVDDLEDPYAWTDGYASLFGVQVEPPDYSGLDVRADAWLDSITFTQDTFWYKWSGTTYNYNTDGEECWFWKYKCLLSDSENTRVIAWVNQIQGQNNAFIIENKNGKGYTYIVNTRNPNSLPNGVLTDALTDFVYFLCSYYARPMTYAPYPETEYWLSQGQANRTVYLQHDNSTGLQTFTYAVKPWAADLDSDEIYVIFEYFGREVYGSCDGLNAYLNVTLETNEAKLFLLLEDNGTPKVLSSDCVLSAVPVFVNQQLSVALDGVEEAKNITTIFCSDFNQPQYVLRTPFNFTRHYTSEDNVLSIISDSNVVVGWENTTDVSVVASTVSLTNVSWNNAFETLTVSANGTLGQEALIQIQTGGAKPYFLTADGKETSAWSYNETTGLWSTSFVFTSDSVDLVFGFKPMVIDQAVVSDERVDVGNVQTVAFHVTWMSDCSDIAGATVYVNGSKFLTNQTGWISFDVVSGVVNEVVWQITGVEYHGFVDYVKAVDDPFIVWDQAKVTESSVFDDVVQVGSVQTLWLTAEYEYDSEIFDGSKGTVFVNGNQMIWSDQNLRWELNVTSDTVGMQIYELSSFVDYRFELTSILTHDVNMSVTWDKIEITKTELETNTLGETGVKVYVNYSFSKRPVVNAKVSVDDVVCTEIEQGIYLCRVSGWGPIQSVHVEADFTNFEQTTKTETNVHIVNTVVYVAVGLLIILLVAFFVFKRKTKQKLQN